MLWVYRILLLLLSFGVFIWWMGYYDHNQLWGANQTVRTTVTFVLHVWLTIIAWKLLNLAHELLPFLF